MIPYAGMECTTPSIDSGRVSEIIALLSDYESSQFKTVTFSSSVNRALDELLSIYEECSFEGWDGYGAAPITDVVYQNAFFFIRILPFGFPIPEIGAEPDGHISLEWYKDVDHLVSVSISPENKLYYAAFFGNAERHGAIPFTGSLPKEICDAVREVQSA